MAQCRSCGAEIWWGIMASTGKPHPFDAASFVGPPDPLGVMPGNHMQLASGEDEGRMVKLDGPLLTKAQDEGVKLWRSHFASCPDRVKWAQGDLFRMSPGGVV